MGGNFSPKKKLSSISFRAPLKGHNLLLDEKILCLNPTALRTVNTVWSVAILSAIGLRVAPVLEGQHIPGEQTGSHKIFCSLKNCRRKWRCIHKKR